MAGYTQIDGERGVKNKNFTQTTWKEWKNSSVSTWKLFGRR